MDIAKNGNKGSGPVLMDRTQALTQLWTHAVARNGARKDEVVTAGALDAAATVCSPKFAADPPAQGAAAGLLAVLAKDPELCPRMIELKVDTFALDLCHCDSTAANDAAVSLLARLAENPNTRPAVVKTTTQRIAGWECVVRILRTPGCTVDARTDAVRFLNLACEHGRDEPPPEGGYPEGAEPQSSAPEVRRHVAYWCPTAIAHLLDLACDDTVVGGTGPDDPPVQTPEFVTLRSLAATTIASLSREEAIKDWITRDKHRVRVFVDALKSTVATLKVRAQLATALYNACDVTASVLEKLRLSDDGAGNDGGAGGGGGAAVSSSDSAAAAMFPGGFGSAMVQSPPHDEELRRLGLLVDAGAMTPLVRMCAGAKGYLPPKEPVPPSPVKGESSHAEEDKGEVAQEEASAGEGGGAAEGDADDDANAEGEGGDDGGGDDGGGGDGEGADGDEKADADADGEGDGEGGGGGEEEGGGKKKKKKGKKKGGKKKAATKPPAGMGAGQLAAAGLLRAFTREPEWAALVARSDGARMLVQLSKVKEDQTRWHAQAALYAIAADIDRNGRYLDHAKCPEYITRVSAIRRQQPMRPSVKFVSAPVESAWLKTGAA